MNRLRQIWDKVFISASGDLQLLEEYELSNRQILDVYISKEKNKVTVKCGSKIFLFSIESEVEVNIFQADFAVWLCLPLAMSEGKNLVVHGQGTETTKKNAEKLTDIWSSWLPKQYSMVNVDFDEYREESKDKNTARALMCFSGGVDSTYSFITHDFSGLKPDLLTIQGMDYSINDSVRFSEAIKQTNILIQNRSRYRLFVQSNAYDIYKQYKIGGQLSHVFLLTAVGFMFSQSYKSMLLSADHSCYQQFEVFPAGSTFASNQFFNSGEFALETHGEDVTRAEKLAIISDDPSALLSLSFCKNRKIRPKNCGICSKCLRTKYMFMASIGEIPAQTFLDASVPSFKSLRFSVHDNLSHSYIKDTFKVAFRNDNLDKIPDVIRAYKKIQKES